MNYQEFDLASSQKWQEYLDRLNEADRDIYFTPEYYRLYEEFGDGVARCFVYNEGDNIAIYPFLQNSINDLGYSLDRDYYDIQGAYGYNGVLSSSKDTQFIKNFNEAFNSYCNKKGIVAEFTRFHPLLNNKEFSQSALKVIDDRETVFLRLDDSFDEIWEKQFSSKNRNMIRKATKLGYTIEVLESPQDSDLKKFIEIYYRSMKAVNADQYFYFNENYFLNTFQYLKQHSYLFNVKNIEGETVCSSIFYKYGEYFHYHLSGRSEIADNSVNNFLLSEAVRYAKSIDAKFIHLGGGRSNSSDDSLLKFKKSFSKTAVVFAIGKKVHNQAIYDSIERQWNDNNLTIKDQYKNFLLKYRVKNI